MSPDEPFPEAGQLPDDVVLIVPREAPGADEIFGTRTWQHPEEWPDDEHPMNDPLLKVVFLGRAIERLSAYAPGAQTWNERRLWAGKRIGVAARVGNVRTTWDSPDGGSWFKATGDPERDRQHVIDTLKHCGVRHADGYPWNPLFIFAADFDRLLNEVTFSRGGVLLTTRTRRPAGVNFAIDDAPLLEEMGDLINRGQATGPYNAALAVAHRAKGHGNGASKAKRLAKRYLSHVQL